MVGELNPGPRRLQQFVAVDRQGGNVSYSRSCMIESGAFVMVKVPLRRGRPDKSALSEADRRFVDQNITPAEYRASGNGQVK